MDKNRTLLVYRGVGLVAVTATSVAAYIFGDQFPALHLVVNAVCWYVGKVVGVPADAVVTAALQVMRPDRAATVTLDALRSMPPLQSEVVTRSLLASIPPPPRAPVIEFMNTAPSEPPTDDHGQQT